MNSHGCMACLQLPNWEITSELNGYVRLNITAYINWKDNKCGVLLENCLDR